MAKILVHLTHGPEHPTRAALAFLVAKAAIEEGHSITFFLAGNAVQLMRDGVLDNLGGLGTGRLRASYDAVVAGRAKIESTEKRVKIFDRTAKTKDSGYCVALLHSKNTQNP